MLPQSLLALAALAGSAVAKSTEGSTSIFPLTWMVTSLNGNQLQEASKGKPHYSYVAFAFTDPIARNIVQCHRQLPNGDYKTPIVDGKYYACEDKNVQFALATDSNSQSGLALGLKYTFTDSLGLFTTDCGKVSAASINPLALDSATTGSDQHGKYFDAGQVFVPWAYNETAAGPTSKCKPKRLGDH